MKKPRRKRVSMDELLLDTTYILPIFGLKVELKGFQTTFPRLLNTRPVVYNPVTIVEAKWIVLKLVRKNPASGDALLRAYRSGLRALQSDERLKQTVLTDDAIEEVADRLLTQAKLKDYFDRLIYATSSHLGCTLLTEDGELHKIAMSGRMPKPKRIVRWEELID